MATDDVIEKVTRDLVEHLRTSGADMAEASLTDDQGRPTGLVLVCLDPELAADLRTILHQWQQGLAARGDLEIQEHEPPG